MKKQKICTEKLTEKTFLKTLSMSTPKKLHYSPL
jgi:hypothetical protein